ncbi:CYTH and CHAD domain-containing protein [Pseudofrankia asymbiotica]|uniref:Metal-binding protein n=1 Tax=Pseudofrankia asymbiotica TaxID=1834516 RepID=A0A1V2I8E9_9ACTN|nr:CYTH and CHAD domain-containing protein [Pseudofrankia asymbiotica]ONH28657.1 metal-binding protein [Pseudofrankia asymbiotica]
MGMPTRQHREVETKFDVDSTFVLPPLERVDEVTPAGAPTEHRLDAVYYDTEDLRLARNKITLRRREGGHDAGWHLKLPAGGAGRDEISRPLGAGTPDGSDSDSTVPGDLADIVLATTRGRPLNPVARIQTVRRAVTLRDAAGRPRAEVADDTVRAQTLGAATTLSQWRELEVEALGDDLDVLPATATVLLRAGARPATGPSKLARTLGTRVSRPELPELGGDSGDGDAGPATAGEVIRSYLSTHTGALLAADARVRLDEPESVHDLRVAARRLRSTLRTFRALFDPERTRRLEARLRDLNLLLNGARDGEVQLERFSGQIGELAERDVLGPVAARVQGHLRSQQLRGREQALTWLRGDEYLTFLEDLITFVREPAYTPLGRRPAREVLRRPVRRSDRKLRRRVEQATAIPPGPARDAALHGARKAAKRLRYAAEAVEVVYGPAATKHASRTKKIQNILGEHQDCVVAQDTLREFAIAANAAGESSFTYGLLLCGERDRARHARGSLTARWPALSRRRDRRWLR